MKPTRLDRRRLDDGARGLMLPMPEDPAGLTAYLREMRDSLTAMQSLDDLGSVEANEAASRDHDELLARYLAAERRLAELKGER